uniref:Tyrosine protein kinase, putative n=1 Tax=Entamoeba invadens TaxID=33085 RepID=S0AZ67_ENTIV|nr:tyrosine protein kinase, putative [Entamoeba invadens]
MQSSPSFLKVTDVSFDPKKDKLGSGSFGTVYRGIVMGLPVAVKVPNKQKLSYSERRDFLNEIGVLKKVFHPNIVLFMGACTESTIMIVSELMAADLDALLYRPQSLPESLRITLTPAIKLKLCSEMALGVNWLHSAIGLVHRDLKPENFMVDRYMTVKVTDFGFTVFPADVRGSDWKGTPYYIAPEVADYNEVSFAGDVYALSYIMWQTFTQKDLYPEYDDFDIFAEDILQGGKRPEIDDSVPEKFVPTMIKMWDGDPDNRPTAKEVLDELQKVSLDISLKSEKGIEFWKKHFFNAKTGGLELEVEKNDFFNEVAKEVQITLKSEEKLHNIFESKKVLPENFQKTIDLFGNYFQDKGLMEDLNEICTKDYFAFDITREIAQSWLANRVDGFFIVRLSSKSPEAPFVISYNYKGECKHNRLTRISFDGEERYKTKSIVTGKFVTGKTVPEIVEKCVNEKMISAVCPLEKAAQNAYS